MTSEAERMMIYLVLGATSEYDSYDEQVICAFRTKALAQDYADRLNVEQRQVPLRDRAHYAVHVTMLYDDFPITKCDSALATEQIRSPHDS